MPMFIATLFTIAKTWKQLKCPLTDEWLRENVTHTHIHIHTGILFNHKKEGTPAICNNMDGT